MPGIGIITNPHSKLNKRKPQRSKILGYILGQHGKIAKTDSLEDLDIVAAKFRDSDIDILAINGGDGTISQTLSSFIKAYGEKPLPKVALLRGGTMNVLASNLYLTGSPEKLMYRLIEAYSTKDSLDSVKISSLKVEDHYGFLFADGIAYTVLDEFYKNKTGPVGAALLILRIALSGLWQGKFFKKIVYATKRILNPTNYEPIEHQSMSVMAATIERMPYGLKLFPKARERLGQLQFFSVFSTQMQVLWHLPSILLRNKPGRTTGKISLCCEQLEIQGKQGYTYTLDGELHTAQSQKVTLEMGPTIEFVLY